MKTSLPTRVSNDNDMRRRDESWQGRCVVVEQRSAADEQDHDKFDGFITWTHL